MDAPKEPDVSSALANRSADYVTSAAKAVLGVVPFAGSLLAEVAGTIIPNQRVDRIAKFAAILDEKLSHLEQEFVRGHLTDENFTDLLEEGIRQAARSVTDERRQYIASLISRGVEASHVEFIESKHLLRILGEINDIEIIRLRFYLVPTIGGDREFRDRHKDIVERVPAYIGASREVLDKAALQESYDHHLAELDLLRPRYHTDSRTGLPEFDRMTGAPKVWHHEITPLGRLLLRHIGLSANENVA